MSSSFQPKNKESRDKIFNAKSYCSFCFSCYFCQSEERIVGIFLGIFLRKVLTNAFLCDIILKRVNKPL